MLPYVNPLCAEGAFKLRKERGGKRGKEGEKGRGKEGVITRRRDGEEKWRE